MSSHKIVIKKKNKQRRCEFQNIVEIVKKKKIFLVYNYILGIEMSELSIIRNRYKKQSPKKLDDTGIEPGTSHMLSECDNQLHQTPGT